MAKRIDPVINKKAIEEVLRANRDRIVFLEGEVRRWNEKFIAETAAHAETRERIRTELLIPELHIRIATALDKPLKPGPA